jgi:hypothetical protein
MKGECFLNQTKLQKRQEIRRKEKCDKWNTWNKMKETNPSVLIPKINENELHFSTFKKLSNWIFFKCTLWFLKEIYLKHKVTRRLESEAGNGYTRQTLIKIGCYHCLIVKQARLWSKILYQNKEEPGLNIFLNIFKHWLNIFLARKMEYLYVVDNVDLKYINYSWAPVGYSYES